MLNRDPAPVEVFNDLDSNLVNFFKVLRERPEELQRALELTPYSREEFELACGTDLFDEDLDELERARLFFVRVQQSQASVGANPSSYDYGYDVKQSRRNRANCISHTQNKISSISDIAERFHRVQIESKSFVDVFQRYDSEETLFYCDPPYPESVADTSVRGDGTYISHMSEQDHSEFLEVLAELDGVVAISGFTNDLYVKKISTFDDDWSVSFADKKTTTTNVDGSVSSKEKQEVLWTNYDPSELCDTDAPTPTASQATLD
jgi:DNA adenine methylase